MGMKILAVIMGLLIGVIITGIVNNVGDYFYPEVAGQLEWDKATMEAYIAARPVGAMLCVLAGYIIGPLVSGWVSGKIGSSMVTAKIVGVLWLIGAGSKVLVITHPMWFTALVLLAVLPCAWVGGRIANREGQE